MSRKKSSTFREIKDLNLPLQMTSKQLMTKPVPSLTFTPLNAPKKKKLSKSTNFNTINASTPNLRKKS